MDARMLSLLGFGLLGSSLAASLAIIGYVALGNESRRKGWLLLVLGAYILHASAIMYCVSSNNYGLKPLPFVVTFTLWFGFFEILLCNLDSYRLVLSITYTVQLSKH